METIVNALAVFMASFFLAMVPAWMLWRLAAAPRGRSFWLLLVGHAFGCLILLLLLNGLPGFFGENADTYAKLNLVKASNADVQRHFVLIDNSGNKQLVPDPDANAEDSIVRLITDRAKLARLLQRLAVHQDSIAQVVVDIAFAVPSPADSALREAVLDLAVHDKILLARAVDENTPMLRFGVNVMADVTERMQENIVAWHSAARETGNSLPYTLYLRLHALTVVPFTMGLWMEDGPAGCRLVHSGFMPSWAYLTELNNGAAELSLDELPLPIGHVLDAGWPALMRRLQVVGDGPMPVIFIGEFPEEMSEGTTDRHRTYLGERTGSTMLIDLYHEIEAGAHVVKVGALITLFFALFICSWLVFRVPWQSPPDARPDTFGAMIRARLWDVVKSLFPLLFLWGMALVIRSMFGQQLNLAPILLYFVALTPMIKAIRLVR